ncbi:MAG: flagellar basal body P-ring formation chaperone FlgA [Myxococcales bacterium]|nr:flagellar basal body P-ring formation chaperone FlgA [Myxococcales bacterium]
MSKTLVAICVLSVSLMPKIALGSNGNLHREDRALCASSGPRTSLRKLVQKILGDELEFRIVENQLPMAPNHSQKLKYCAQQVAIDGSQRRMKVVLATPNRSHPVWRQEFWISWVLRQAVVVPAKTIYRGKTLRKDDLRLKKVEIGDDIERYSTTLDELVGKIAVGTLLPERIVPSRLVADPPLVFRGRPVVAKVRAGKMMVTMTGQALEDGAVGDLVKVLNTRSKQILQGVVQNKGVVEVY